MERVPINAPQGPLGLIFAPESTVLKMVREASPLFGRVEVGWTLVGVDREDVSHMDGAQVTKLLKMRSHNPQGRHLEFKKRSFSVRELPGDVAVAAPKPHVTVHSPVMDLYAVLWSVDVLVQSLLFHQPSGAGVYVAYALVAFGALTCAAHAFHLEWRRNVLVVALALRLVDVGLRLPMSWDSEWWALQTDAALLVRLLTGATAGRTIQLQMALFYAAAGFWKLNTSFLDGPSSCAAVFGVQTAARAALMLGGGDDAAVRDWEAVLAPLAQTYTPRVVIALELSIALGLLLKPNVGVRVGVLFHAINAWAPPAPNNIASFSLVCLVRLVTFAPKAAADALHFTMRNNSALICAGVAALLGAAVQQFKAGRDPQCIAAVGYLVLAPIVLLACRGTFPGGKRRVHAPSKARTRFVAVALLYCATPLLGVLELGAPNMYANLRMRAGSNHLFAPTGLLFKTGLLGAETLTVVKTTSQHVLDYYPGDCTEELKPAENRARAFAAVGMRPFFNYALKRVIKCSYTKNTWRPFDVPAIELRRILGEMAAAGKAATLTYKDGDRTIQVGYDADGNQVKCSGCTPDDVASQGPLPFWAEKFLVYIPYPVLADGNAEMPCAGP